MKKYTQKTSAYAARDFTRTIFIAGCLVIFISAGNVFAQAGLTGQQGFLGQSAFGLTDPGGGNLIIGQPIMVRQPITVSEARNLPHDSWVVLSGNIINMLPGGKQYTFRDSSGDIAVEIGRKEWRGLSVDMSDRVEIYGEVKLNRGLIHIKVRAISGTGRGVNNWQWHAVTVTQPITINEARNLPHDSWVVLNGNIVGLLSSSKNYVFRDASGEIMVDIGRKEWRGLSIGVSDRVEIFGEVKHNKGQVHIKVRAIGMTGV